MKKKMKEIIALSFIMILVIGNADVLDAKTRDVFSYQKGDKVYSQSKIIKKKTHFIKNTNVKKHATQFQIVRLFKNSIKIRPQKSWFNSEDPLFKGKTVVLKLASSCKYYYRDVGFPYKKGQVYYKRASINQLKRYLRKSKINYDYVEDFEGKKGNYYFDGFFGEIYLKNNKVVAILMDGGD